MKTRERERSVKLVKASFGEEELNLLMREERFKMGFDKMEALDEAVAVVQLGSNMIQEMKEELEEDPSGSAEECERVLEFPREVCLEKVRMLVFEENKIVLYDGNEAKTFGFESHAQLQRALKLLWKKSRKTICAWNENSALRP